MKFPAKLTAASALFALAATVQSTVPASAITVELANKCREMSLKAFPPARAGTKTNSATEARKYYGVCVANGGNVPQDQQPKPATAPAR